MILYIIKEMIKHLSNLLFVNIGLVFLLRKRSGPEYNIKLVKQSILDVVISATVIGLVFVFISISLLITIKWDKNMLVVLAGVLISFGTGRQIFATSLDTVTTSMNGFLSSWASILHLLAKDRLSTPAWRSIEVHIELLLFGKEIQYDPPSPFDDMNVRADPQQIYRYLNAHRAELGYQDLITDEEYSSIAFAQYATGYLIEKLRIYLKLVELQERVGGVNTVILIAAGTLIWLFS
jgi:hypothetical protein